MPQHDAIRVLVADDEESMRHFVHKGLARLGYDVTAVADGDRAVAAWNEHTFDLAVLDVRMPGRDGTSVLAHIRSQAPDAIVVLISAHGTVDSAVEAMHLGAADFVTKPFALDELQLRIERALQLHRTVQDHQRLRTLLEAPYDTLGLCASSAPMQEVVRQLELAATSSSTVLLTGESGTGKGLLAKALHLLSKRSEQPFLALNCASVPDALAESELFGHTAGAFTGARTNKKGLLERAHGGTVFLDEIGDMSLPTQAKIERFLQDRELVPLGGDEPVRVDVRIVAATNRQLPELVESGAFRAELLYRLDVVTLCIPPLRDRRDDVPDLIRTLLRKKAGDDRDFRFTPEALAVLSAYHWPGNVRELENVIERMIVLAGDRRELGVQDLPSELRTSDDGAAAAVGDDGYDAARARFDRLYFANLLRRTAGNVTEAARLCGLSRGHVHRRLKELGVAPGGQS